MNYSHDFYDTLRFKSEIKKLVKENDKDFSIKPIFEGIENKNVVGVFNKDGDNFFAIIQFFNAFENTKSNFYKSLTEFLELSDEEILSWPNFSKNILNEMLNPFHIDERLFHLENLIIRLCSMWDQLAHIVNILYSLKINPKEVSSTKIFKKNVISNPTMDKISQYYNEVNDYFDFNINKFVSDIRNLLIHYSDFSSLKFYSNYIDTFLPVGYPTAYIFIVAILDFMKLMELTTLVYEDYLNNYPPDKSKK